MNKAGCLMLLISLFSVFLLSCTPAEKVCSIDSDCVPAACCHATDAVNAEHGPDCRGVFCTAVCQPGTLDCGQGKVNCISGQCTAVIE